MIPWRVVDALGSFSIQTKQCCVCAVVVMHGSFFMLTEIETERGEELPKLLLRLKLVRK